MYKVLLFIFSFLILSCGDKEEEKIPEFVLPKEKMTAMLTDIYIIDAATNIHSISGITLPANPVPGYDRFLKHHNVSYEEFRKSYEWYMERPKDLNEIYTEVLNELSKKQAEYSKK